MKVFNELWALLKDMELIQVRESEMEAMYKHCFEFRNPRIIEIGSAHGASSIIFAEAVQELEGMLFCIDSYPENYYDQPKFGSYAKQQFEKNVLENYRGNVIFMNMTSDQAAQELPDSEEFDIIFIDGMHSYDAVRSDCLHYLPKLKSGGYVGFHDYNNVAFQVKEAADDFCGGWEKESIWDLAIFKKP